MIAAVVVDNTYDQRDTAPLLHTFLYMFAIIGRVVVCKTYDRSDGMCVSHRFCKHVGVVAPVVVGNRNTK